MSNVFFTSDTHFDHANVIKYCNRPFDHKDEMNEAMIQNWNSVVKPGDTIYHLGDFAFSNKPEVFFHRLNGNKVLIKGNHDKKPATQLPWAFVRDYYELKLDGKSIVMCHYAFRVFNKSHHGAIHLYGHSHGSLPGNSQSLDVGVDSWNYTPVSLEEILVRLKTLPLYRPVDHHA